MNPEEIKKFLEQLDRNQTAIKNLALNFPDFQQISKNSPNIQLESISKTIHPLQELPDLSRLPQSLMNLTPLDSGVKITDIIKQSGLTQTKRENNNKTPIHQ